MSVFMQIVVVQWLRHVKLCNLTGLQHARLPCPLLSPRVCSNSCPLSWWYYLIISSSAALFSFCLQSSPASRSSPMNRLLALVANVLELQLQHQSFQWIFRVDFLLDWVIWSPCSSRDSQGSSPAPQFKSISSSALSLLDGPTFYIHTWLLEKP